MRLLILSLTILILCFSCGNDKPALPELDPETRDKITALKTDGEKNKYLFNLWQEDQNLRRGQGQNILAKFGKDSEEYKRYVKEIVQLDHLVFAKMKFYLETHNYPKNVGRYDELALNAFPTIIGHHHHYKAQAELLPYLYEAYKTNHCSLDDVVWVMGEMHESKHGGRRYVLKSNVFTTEQEFKELSSALGLDLEI